VCVVTCNNNECDKRLDQVHVVAASLQQHDVDVCSHEDGSVRFWDVSATRMNLLYKLSTSSIFGISTSQTQEASRTQDGEDDWPPFRKVAKCRVISSP